MNAKKTKKLNGIIKKLRKSSTKLAHNTYCNKDGDLCAVSFLARELGYSKKKLTFDALSITTVIEKRQIHDFVAEKLEVSKDEVIKLITINDNAGGQKRRKERIANALIRVRDNGQVFKHDATTVNYWVSP